MPRCTFIRNGDISSGGWIVSEGKDAAVIIDWKSLKTTTVPIDMISPMPQFVLPVEVEIAALHDGGKEQEEIKLHVVAYLTQRVLTAIESCRTGNDYSGLMYLINTLEMLAGDPAKRGFFAIAGWPREFEQLLGTGYCYDVAKTLFTLTELSLEEALAIYNEGFRQETALNLGLSPDSTWEQINAERKAMITTITEPVEVKEATVDEN